VNRLGGAGPGRGAIALRRGRGWEVESERDPKGDPEAEINRLGRRLHLRRSGDDRVEDGRDLDDGAAAIDDFDDRESLDNDHRLGVGGRLSVF
jgi:hypothetical protein